MAEETKSSEEKKEKSDQKKKRSIFHKIVNVFLYIGLGIFLLILIIFAFSQTSTFRDFLRETAMEEANKVLNGTVYIGEIEGTIFTSLILRNTVVSMEGDTLLNANKIEIRTSPLQLFLKKIYFRKIEIQNASISLEKNEQGELNISRLFPESEEDTTTSTFSFDIEAANLNLVNVNFSLKDENLDDEYRSYDTLNLNDLRVSNLNLRLSAFADISANEYRVTIDKFNAALNLNKFSLKNLSGGFRIDTTGVLVRNFNLETFNSDLNLEARVLNFNLFDSTAFDRLGEADINVSLNADKFNFNDLSTFVTATNILQGTLSTNLVASGTMNDLAIDNLDIGYNNTHLALTGRVQNIVEGENLYINADFFDSYVYQPDINNLLPDLDVPTYEEYGTIKFDTLSFQGRPLDFKSRFYVVTDKGNIGVNGSVNLTEPLMKYDLNFATNNFDLQPFIGMSSNVNSNGSIQGSGTSPENLNANVTLKAGGSNIDGKNLDTLRLIASASNKIIDYDLKVSMDTSAAQLSGDLNFSDANNPTYNLNGNVRNLNLYDFSPDSTLISDLNFEIEAEGENFDPNKMNLYVSLLLTESSLNNVPIDSSRAIIDLRRDVAGERVVNIISDLADITLQGNFEIPRTISLLSAEADLINKVVQQKMDEFSTADSVNQRLALSESIGEKTPSFESVDSTSVMRYTIEFKDFSLLTVIMGNNQLEIDGEMNGEIISSADSLLFTYNADISYIKYWGESDVFFLSDLKLSLDLQNSYDAKALENINADLSLSTSRVFMGNDINDINLDLRLKNKVADINFNAAYEDFASVNLEGDIDLSGSMLEFTVDSLGLRYQNFQINNKNRLVINYSKERIEIDSFTLVRNDAEIDINGYLVRDGDQNLKINVSNLSGLDLSTSLLELRPENSLDADISLSADVKGDFSAPVINIELNVDSVTYRNKNFGSLNGDFDYQNRSLAAKVNFINAGSTSSDVALEINGVIPMDLSFGTDQKIVEDKSMNLKISAKDFNLGAFGDVLPAVNKLRGNFSAELELTGTPDNYNPSGNISLSNAAFIVEANNLEYNADIKIAIDNDILSIEELAIRNADGTPNGGTLSGSGQAKLDGFSIISSQFSASGRIKVLGEVSKSASPSIYGDLVISTNGALEFTMKEDRTFIKAPITVEDANITFPPTQSAYQSQQSNFIYKFVEDTSEAVDEEMDFDSLVKLSQQQSSNQLGSGPAKKIPFDFEIDVEVEEEARFTFVLSKEFNQNLTAVLKGNVLYESINGRSLAQGELNLLEGSTLEFFKTLEATGTIRFENEITNPYLNITATYTDYYLPADNSTIDAGSGGTTSSEEILVAVKIRLKGFLKSLDKEFINTEDNVAVYIGQENIENDQPDPTKDVSDAFMFIIAGEFTDNASQGSKNELEARSYALAGSVLGGLLNKQFGSYVRSVQVRQSGGTTRFNLIGRAGDFRYTIGGSTEVFRQLENANVKIEYPIIRNLLLRLERREDITDISTQTEMINELGLKYRFEF